MDGWMDANVDMCIRRTDEEPDGGTAAPPPRTWPAAGWRLWSARVVREGAGGSGIGPPPARLWLLVLLLPPLLLLPLAPVAWHVSRLLLHPFVSPMPSPKGEGAPFPGSPFRIGGSDARDPPPEKTIPIPRTQQSSMPVPMPWMAFLACRPALPSSHALTYRLLPQRRHPQAPRPGAITQTHTHIHTVASRAAIATCSHVQLAGRDLLATTTEGFSWATI